MPRRRTLSPRLATLTPAIRSVLETGHVGTLDQDDPSGLDAFLIIRQPTELRRLWDDVGAELLRTWVRSHPGTRPWAWWRLEAPAAPPDQIPAELSSAGPFIAARRQLDGRGGPGATPAAWSDRGIPPIDGPATFESEATYLDHHELLTAAERRALPDEAFNPETVRDTHEGDHDDNQTIH